MFEQRRRHIRLNIDEDTIAVFAHGSLTPKDILSEDSSKGGGPSGCAVNPLTGDLAVANGGTHPGVAVFAAGSSEAVYYSVPGIASALFCGYDTSGDLFVDGSRSGTGTGFAFAELLAGGSAFRTIKQNKKIQRAGAVQWDGHYITVADAAVKKAAIYQLTISGKKATVVGSVHLNAQFIAQTLILESSVVGPYALHKGNVYSVVSWRYPQGGKPKTLFKRPRMLLYGIALSSSTSDARL
jgi:hypothetical protein